LINQVIDDHPKVQKIDKIEADVAVLKSDVAILKADVAVLKSDVAELKSDVSGLKYSVTRIGVVQEQMKDQMSLVLEVVTAMRQQLDQMLSIPLIVNDHELRLKACERTIQTHIKGIAPAPG
jgi:hypothetical protein